MITVQPGSGPISALRKQPDKDTQEDWLAFRLQVRCRNLEQPRK